MIVSLEAKRTNAYYYNAMCPAGGHIGRNVVEITIKKKAKVRKPLMIKIIKLHLRNLDNQLQHVNDINLTRCSILEVLCQVLAMLRKSICILHTVI